jgi:ATP-binding cassette, subfamily B, multidrug efflux pump
VAQRAVRDMRVDLFAHLQTLPLRFFDRQAHGDLMSRLTNDMENISNVLVSSFSQLFSSVFSLVSVIIVMLLLNVRLALVSLVVAPMTYLLTRILVRYTRQGFRETQSTLGALNGIIEETIAGQKTVKAFVREQTTIDSFCVVNNNLRRVALKARIAAGFMGPLMMMVTYFGLAIVACAGGWLAV